MASKRKVEAVVRLPREALSLARAAERVLPHPGAVAPTRRALPPRRLQLPDNDEPFHFTHHVSRLCADITRRVPALKHVRMERVLVTFAQCRNRHLWGMQGKLVPLRFRDGAAVARRGGHQYAVQKILVGEVECLYVLTLYLPRFLNQTFDEKLITIFHELYHIDPDFRGDIRRFDGRIHADSRREYDRHMADLAREYAATRPPRYLHDFLHLSFDDLRARYREIVGVHIPAPKLIPVRRLPRESGLQLGS